MSLLCILLLCLMQKPEVPDGIIITTQRVELSCDQCGFSEKMIEYTLTNVSSLNYYTWVDYNASFINDDRDSSIYRYFFVIHDDLNLGTLLTDNIDFKSLYPEIGVSFLKLIKPQESFSYIVPIQTNNTFKDHIFYIDELLFTRIIGTSHVNPEVMWNSPFIYITDLRVETKCPYILQRE